MANQKPEQIIAIHQAERIKVLADIAVYKKEIEDAEQRLSEIQVIIQTAEMLIPEPEVPEGDDSDGADKPAPENDNQPQEDDDINQDGVEDGLQDEAAGD